MLSLSSVFYCVCIFRVLYAQDVCPATLPQGLTVAVKDAVRPFNLLAEPFKIDDYNNKLFTYYTDAQSRAMRLNYPNDTIAFIFGYNSSNTFEPNFNTGSLIPTIVQLVDGCIDPYTIHFLEANTMNGPLPYVHVQTAGHVAGMAYFYHPKLIQNPPARWEGKTVFGISYHPDFEDNLWFHSVIVFSRLQSADYSTSEAVNFVGSEANQIALLDRINEKFGNSLTHDEHE